VFVTKENIVCTLKWPSLIAKNGKIFVLQRKEFIGLTPGTKKFYNILERTYHIV
jgi:hypothetical protein